MHNFKVFPYPKRTQNDERVYIRQLRRPTIHEYGTALSK